MNELEIVNTLFAVRDGDEEQVTKEQLVDLTKFLLANMSADDLDQLEFLKFKGEMEKK